MNIQPGNTIGPYCIERSISQGGMSHLFLASLIENPTHKAAIKFNASTKTQYQDWLRREADILRELRHPNIVHIYPLRINRNVVYVARASTVPGEPWYFAMEPILGGGLDHNLRTIVQFPLLWRIELFYQIIITVHYMHRCRYAHLDLKPENIVLRQPPAIEHHPRPVLVDFGSVSPLDRRSRISATVPYAAPEVLQALIGETAEAAYTHPEKADVWALGTILYELLVGQPLITTNDPKEALAHIAESNFPILTALAPDTPKALEVVLSVMLNPSAPERPPLDDLVVAIEEKIAPICPPRLPQQDEP